MRRTTDLVGLALRRLYAANIEASRLPNSLRAATCAALFSSCDPYSSTNTQHWATSSDQQSHTCCGSTTSCSAFSAGKPSGRRTLWSSPTCRRPPEPRGLSAAFCSARNGKERTDGDSSESDEDLLSGGKEGSCTSDEDTMLSSSSLQAFSASEDDEAFSEEKLQGLDALQAAEELRGARSAFLGGSAEAGGQPSATEAAGPPAVAEIPAPGGGSWDQLLAADLEEGLSPKEALAKRQMLEYILRGRHSVNPPKEETVPEEWKHLTHDPAMREFLTASKKKKKFILEQALAGRGQAMEGLDSDDEDEALGGDQDDRDDPRRNFRMKIVDINRTSKGTKAGGVLHFTAMCVVGNGEGVLGHATGRANDVSSAVQKANAKAMQRLTYVPRYRDHTIFYPTKQKYGKSIVIMYPKSSGSGIKASILVEAVCRLAGIKDIGVKVQGSRNARNTVKAVFKAFDDMGKIDETLVEQAA